MMSIKQGSRLVLLSLALFVSGCAEHLSKQQCVNSDWYAQGFKDGRYGKPMNSLAKETKNCAHYHVALDTTQYDKGWGKGIREFCSEENAHQGGLSGQDLIDYCPRELKQAYLRAWHHGLEQYCSPENGFNQGRATTAYPQICSEYNMSDFTLAYRQGLATHQQMQQVKQQMRKTRRNNEALHLTSSTDLTPAEQAEMTQLSRQFEELQQQYTQLEHGSYQNSH